MQLNLLYRAKFLFFVLIFSIGYSTTIKATHVTGGNLTYTCLGGNQFEITLALYRDCSGAAAPSSVTIIRRAVSCGVNTTLKLTEISGTGIEVTPICPTSATKCSGGSLPGVQEYIYKGIVTLAPCSDWVLSYGTCCRNGAIGTIQNPSAQGMYIEAKLNNLAFPCNSSPSFTNHPVPFICVGQPFCYNNGSNDANGDSLSYTLIAPRHSSTANVTYSGGYSASQPLASTPASTFNPITGDICLTPTLLQVTVLAVLVKEWRGGILVGSVMRDIQVRTETCSNNNPYVNGINNTAAYTMNACAGTPLTFNIPTFDADISQNVILSWNAGIAGATFNSGTGTRPTGVFSWTPTLADVSSAPHCFTVTVKDNYCPFLGSQTFSFCITVGGITTTTASTNAVCSSPNGSAKVIVTGGVPPLAYNWTPSGGSGPIASGLAAGSYTCTVTDATGCSKTHPFTLNMNPGGVATISSFTNVTCNGANNGKATVTMGGGMTPPFTYAWTPASAGTTATATNLAPGTYTVVVIDANGCSSSATQLITQPSALSVNPTFTNVGCSGANTGTATATPAGGTAPFTYLWMPGAYNTASITALPIGTYTVTVTDSKACIVTGTANITQPAALAVSSNPSPANCGLTNGSAIVTGSGGFSPYTWLWSNGQTGSSASALFSGTYTVTITDLNLCTLSVPVTISNISGPGASITTFSNVACYGGNTGNATVAVSGGVLPFTYLWSNGQTTPTANNLVSGIYSVTATDATGCVASTSITITQPAKFSVNAVGNNPVCFGNTNGSATAGTVGGTAPYSYAWTTTGNPTTNSVTGLSIGTYSVTVTDAQGCVQNASVTLTNPPTLSTAISKINLSCKDTCNGTATVLVFNGSPPYTYLWNNPAAQTTQSSTELCAGSYTVTVADAKGCPAQGVVIITEPPVLTSVISSTGNLSCFGTCTGFAQVTAAGGTSPYSYSWMPGAVTAATATNLCAGSYTCTVTDSKGCTAIAISTITQPAQLNASVSGTNINCFGTCDGTGNISFSGGTPPYTALWTPTMQSVFNPNNLCTGINTAKVTDANGCFVTGSINLTELYSPIVVSLSTTSSNCGQSNGGACAIVSGGLLPYSFTWNDINTTQDSCVNLISAGTYNVEVSDATGCLITEPANINDILAPTIVITSHTDLLCYGATNATATTAISGGVGPYNGVWTPGGQTNQNPTDLPEGVNTITVTDDAGCIGSKSVKITGPPPINHAVSTLTNASCFGDCDGSATVVAAGGTGALSFLWDDPALQTTATATLLCAGSSIVIITDGNNCTSLDTATIISQPGPLAISSSSFTNIKCFGGNDGSISPVVSGGTPFYNFAWSPGGAASPVANSLAPGTHTLTVTDQKGCSISQNWTITQPPLLTDTSFFSSASCGQASGSAAIIASGGTPPYEYQWNDPALQVNSSALDLYSGNYNVIITDSNNCSIIQNYFVDDIPGPAIDTVTSTPAVCFGDNTGTAMITIVPGTGTLPFVYDWNTGTQITPSATGLTQGPYSITVTDIMGCAATGVVVVNGPPLLQLFMSMNDTICAGDTIQVYATGSGGTPLYTYLWTGDSSSAFTGSGPHMVIPVNSTVYTSLVTDNNGCSTGIEEMFVTVKPPLIVTASDTSICEGATATIYANVAIGNIGPFTYSWDNGSTAQSQTVTPPPGSTSNNYIVAVSDGCSTNVSDTSTVVINPGSIGILQGTPNEGCEPLTVNFTATSNNGVSYYWNFGDGNSGGESFSTNTYMNSGPYTVTLTITTAAGCTTAIDSIAYVTVRPKPSANFVVSLPISSPFVSFTDLSTQLITNWTWDFGDLTTTLDVSDIQNPSYQYPGVGTNYVTLIVMNQFGCTDTITQQIEVIEDYVFYAPNSFSPDGNGINDIFLPKGVAFDINTFKMMIFDRWGNLMYATEDSKKGWDGRATLSSEIAKNDVYVWKVELVDNTNLRHKYIGYVTLIR